jgi:acetyl-CoA acetyltransferase
MSTVDRAVKAAYVYDAVRTPFGRHGGLLSAVRPDDLAACVITAIVERACICIGVGQGLAVVLENAEMST